MIGNITNTEDKTQGFFLAPPLKPSERKAPENCFLSFIDQIQGGLYSSSKLVRNSPRTHRDSYFVIKIRATSVRSYRRNYSHKSVALYRTKTGGCTRGNIEYLTCSFLEIDGSTDNTIKSLSDVLAFIKNNNLPTASDVIPTSNGNFHILWNYSRPLPWTNKGESYWTAQQKRLIKLFKRAGFLVDVSASLNPCQFLRNPSQLQPYNYKRRCRIEIHKSYKKTSLRSLYKALNSTNIQNPRPIRASVKLRRYSRANKTFTATHKELAENLGMSLRTIKTQVSRAVSNGDLRIVARLGNNNEKTRTTQYESMLFIERIPEVQLSILKDNSVQTKGLLRDFKRKGTSVGRRQKTLFALGLYLKHKLGKEASIEAIRGELLQGAMHCHVSVREFERTLKNVMKPEYTNRFSLAKLRDWDLLEPEPSRKSFLH